MPHYKTIFFRSAVNKYRNKSCHCNQGHIHQSILEAGYCNQLAIMVNVKMIKEYRSQVRYPLKIDGVTVAAHVVDFEVITNDGKMEIHEVKGFGSREWQIKKRMFLQCYPHLPYHVVRQAPDWRSQNRNQMRGLKALARRNRRRI